ncbi:GNAT family N-acetyltransferase [Sulfitobacter sabulilitoris]|uniref:GNAT family N-acetyltransferase n=1 Tax=Sulfitobacter sabulilitoris TaxID=2562655 RepID=A0A5S3PHI1_9RHOB|nr:GNAT family N-acetyltransferase [Sulfitobacter sabulilitoris]TMM52791.1 GNAT family N-acetyltransferase [Sulfitobacter sabulilitoris]
MTVTAPQLFEVCDRTWPAARVWQQGPWTLRDGQGGGKRVSAATATGPVEEDDIAAAEDAMRAMGRDPLFMIRDGDAGLDAWLEGRGYQLIDPVVMMSIDVARLTDIPIPRVTAFCIWEPLAIMDEIWAAGGIGPARRQVMERAALKTGILTRWNEKPGGVGFAAIHDGVCMVHAVEVLPHQRQQGVGAWIMRAAAHWAKDHGAHSLSVLCTRSNDGANRLYAGLGFGAVGHYHYRQLSR